MYNKLENKFYRETQSNEEGIGSMVKAGSEKFYNKVNRKGLAV